MISTDPEIVQLRGALAAALADVQAKINDLREVEADLKGQILSTTDGPDVYDAGALTVVVTQAMRIDPAEVQAKYPPEQYPQMYSLTVDTKKVRANVAPNDLESVQKPSSPSVTLR